MRDVSGAVALLFCPGIVVTTFFLVPEPLFVYHSCHLTEGRALFLQPERNRSRPAIIDLLLGTLRRFRGSDRFHLRGSDRFHRRVLRLVNVLADERLEVCWTRDTGEP